MNEQGQTADLRPLQLFFPAAAVVVVSAGYGALLSLLPAWLAQQMPGSTSTEVARHVGWLSGAYTAGVLVGAPVWGWISDRAGRPRILIDADPAVSASAGFAALWWLAVAVHLVLSGFELGIVLQGRQHAELSTQQVALMFAECSLVMLGINALLFLTGLLDKVPPRWFVAAGSVLGMAGLAVLALHQTNTGMYIGVSLTSAGTGLVLPPIAFLAAGASHRSLGVTMGGLAATGALGQTLGSAATDWLFGAVARVSFARPALPLLATLIALLLQPSWWRHLGQASRAAPTPITNERHAFSPQGNLMD